jgi:hypothetical protein
VPRVVEEECRPKAGPVSQPVDSVSVEIEYDTSQSLHRLRSAIDSALTGVVREFDQAFEAVERVAGTAGDDIGREISQGGERAEGAIREVERQARTSFNRVSREATEAGANIKGKLGGRWAPSARPAPAWPSRRAWACSPRPA